eukprot:248599-Amphidinium_carterae.1
MVRSWSSSSKNAPLQRAHWARALALEEPPGSSIRTTCPDGSWASARWASSPNAVGAEDAAGAWVSLVLAFLFGPGARPRGLEPGGSASSAPPLCFSAAFPS